MAKPLWESEYNDHNISLSMFFDNEWTYRTSPWSNKINSFWIKNFRRQYFQNYESSKRKRLTIF
ncbi:hypothetical protein HAV25_19805 [Elizabethkingia miricola]|nr:hypothetical protein [Elizabethkingia miricola]